MVTPVVAEIADALAQEQPDQRFVRDRQTVEQPGFGAGAEGVFDEANTSVGTTSAVGRAVAAVMGMVVEDSGVIEQVLHDDELCVALVCGCVAAVFKAHLVWFASIAGGAKPLDDFGGARPLLDAFEDAGRGQLALGVTVVFDDVVNRHGDRSVRADGLRSQASIT